MSVPPEETPTSPAPIAAVVILAAGEGKRMKSSRSKLLHELAGHSMLSYAVTAATTVQPEHIVVVVGHGRDQVEAHLAEIAPHASIAVQPEQRGTGHAVQIALAQLGDLTGDVIVTMGDVPMLTGDTLSALAAEHRSRASAVTVLTARVLDPTGYGRIVRDEVDGVAGIVEHRDADDEQRQINEINSGIYVFDAETLRAGLAELAPSNVQGELYLTDVLGHARRAGKSVAAYPIDDLWQTEGVNDRVQLSRMNAEMNRRILDRWMRAGVTVVDPATTWVQAAVGLGTDVTLLPGTSLEGATTVGDRGHHRSGHDPGRRRGRRGRHRDPHPGLAERHRRRGQRRPVRLSPAGHGARGRRQDRHLRGDQERADSVPGPRRRT